MKDYLKDINEERGNPEKKYGDKMQQRTNHTKNTNDESEARDLAKVHKSVSGENQKIDSVHQDDLQNGLDDYAPKETERLK
ncbi:MAG: hypothetical protein C4329_09060 [Chitinophagaceae bacterium]